MIDKEKMHQILSSLWENDDKDGKIYYNKALQDVQIAIDSLQEEPVSEDFEEALAKEWKGYNDRGAATVDALEDNTQELSFAKGFYRGAKWKAEQFEKERLKQCDTLTKEQAQIESDFVTNFIKENNSTPTFIDAIEYGMKMQKEQMLAKTINAECFGFQDAALFSFRLPSDNYLVGSKVKVIVIKED